MVLVNVLSQQQEETWDGQLTRGCPWVVSLRNESSDLTFCRKPASVKDVDWMFLFAELFSGIGRDENGSSVFNGNIISAFELRTVWG